MWHHHRLTLLSLLVACVWFGFFNGQTNTCITSYIPPDALHRVNLTWYERVRHEIHDPQDPCDTTKLIFGSLNLTWYERVRHFC